MINKSTTLKELLDIDGGQEILSKHQLPCLSCPMAAYEISELKIGDVCAMYGLNETEIIKDFNALVNKGRKNNKTKK